MISRTVLDAQNDGALQAALHLFVAAFPFEFHARRALLLHRTGRGMCLSTTCCGVSGGGDVPTQRGVAGR